jgi:aldehyde dehydrogenase (NAD+)
MGSSEIRSLLQREPKLYINSQWVDPSSGEFEDVISPASEQVLCQSPVGNCRDLDSALTAARRAFDEGPWPTMSGKERGRYLHALHAELTAREKDLARLVVLEVGAPQALALNLHVRVPLRNLEFFADLAAVDSSKPLPLSLAPRPDGTAVLGAAVAVSEPVGVVAGITAFNFPFNINISKLGPSLAAGNTLVLKPSPYTPLEAIALAEGADAVGFPAGVINVVTGGREVGEMLTSDPRVDMVTFTGSDTVGAAIVSQSASTLKKVLLELGGKSPMIVLGDADLDAVVPFGVQQVTTQAGQACGLCTRHIVHASRYDEYVARLSEALSQVSLGDPTNDPTVAMGPLIRESQRLRVENYVAGAVAAGARVVTGGRRPPHLDKGFFYEPTVVAELTNDFTICQEEIFGPVAVVLRCTDDSEAVHIANDCRYGLSGSVWSADVGHAYRIARRIRTGGVHLNGGRSMLDPADPFGGTKRSGLGREYGFSALAEYQETKTIKYHAG